MPLWRSMASTSVVLPWSTCAMMAILRIDVVIKLAIRFLLLVFQSGQRIWAASAVLQPPNDSRRKEFLEQQTQRHFSMPA